MFHSNRVRAGLFFIVAMVTGSLAFADFQPGDILRAEDLNERFDELNTSLEGLRSQVVALEARGSSLSGNVVAVENVHDGCDTISITAGSDRMECPNGKYMTGIYGVDGCDLDEATCTVGRVRCCRL